MLVDEACTVILSIRSPELETGTKARMFAAASPAVAVGPLVVQAVAAERLAVIAYGVAGKIGWVLALT